MALSALELRLAMSWRVREISYYQMVIEETHCSPSLNDGERRRLRIFASEEIHKLNRVSDKEVVDLYLQHLLAVKNVAQMADFIEEEID